MTDPSFPEESLVEEIGRSVRRRLSRQERAPALRFALGEVESLLESPTDALRHALRRRVFKVFSSSGVSSYQINDFEPMHYELFDVAADLPMFRGPSPSKQQIEAGDYFCTIGAAQTFGRLVRRPYGTVVSDTLGLPVLNLSRAGAGPELFLDPRLVKLIAGARFVVLQVMSGRSAGCADFPGGRTVTMANGGGVQRWDVLEKLWNDDRANAIRYVRRWNESYLELYRQIRARIDRPVLLLWFSERPPEDWSPRILEKRLTWGGFPQLVGRDLYERVADLFDDRCEAVMGRTSEDVRSRVTGDPCPYFGDSGKNFHYANTYYPSSQCHAVVARAIAPWAERALKHPARHTA